MKHDLLIVILRHHQTLWGKDDLLTFRYYLPDYYPEEGFKSSAWIYHYDWVSCPCCDNTLSGEVRCSAPRQVEMTYGVFEFRYYVHPEQNNFQKNTTENFIWYVQGAHFDGFEAHRVKCNITITNAHPIIKDGIKNYAHWKKPFKFDILNHVIEYDIEDKNRLYFKQVNSITPSGCGSVSWNKTEQRLIFQGNGVLGSCIVNLQVRDFWSYSQPNNIEFIVYNQKPEAKPAVLQKLFREINHTIGVNSFVTDADSDDLTLTLGPLSMEGCASVWWNNNTKQIEVIPLTLGLCNFTFEASDGLESTNGQINLLFIKNNLPVVPTRSFNLHWARLKEGFKITKVLDGIEDLDNDTVVLHSMGTVTPPIATISMFDKDTILITGIENKFVNDNITVSYFVFDGKSKAEAFYNIRITNNRPTITPKSVTHHWSKHRDGFEVNLVEDGVDADNDPITVESTQPIVPTTAEGRNITTRRGIFKSKEGSRFSNDKFTMVYTITDGIESFNTSFEAIIYNQVPVARDDNYDLLSLVESQVLDVVANDQDGDRPLFDNVLTIKEVNGARGTVTIIDNSTKLRYLPGVEITLDTFTYTLTDGMGEAQGTVKVDYKNVIPLIPKNVTIPTNSTNPTNSTIPRNITITINISSSSSYLINALLLVFLIVFYQ